MIGNTCYKTYTTSTSSATYSIHYSTAKYTQEETATRLYLRANKYTDSSTWTKNISCDYDSEKYQFTTSNTYGLFNLFYSSNITKYSIISNNSTIITSSDNFGTKTTIKASLNTYNGLYDGVSEIYTIFNQTELYSQYGAMYIGTTTVSDQSYKNVAGTYSFTTDKHFKQHAVINVANIFVIHTRRISSFYSSKTNYINYYSRTSNTSVFTSYGSNTHVTYYKNTFSTSIIKTTIVLSGGIYVDATSININL